MSRFETTIGLEVHVQLRSATKIFCRCPVIDQDGGVPANAASCPVCQGHPGVLPALDPEVVELAAACGLALHCELVPRSIFERKHYFYPDIPKNYQITQNEVPIARGGWLALRDRGGDPGRRVRIRRVHMEEDAAKNVHATRGGVAVTLVDFNRCGTPLLEIVSEPDLGDPQEAVLYLEQLQRLVRWHGLSSANMERGEMRCDANLSVRPRGTPLARSVRWEIKNVNSPRFVGRALALAQERQAALLLAHPELPPCEVPGLVQETYGYDDAGNQLQLQRRKETEDDYFYFDEPDLADVVVTPALEARARRRLRRDLEEVEEELLGRGLPWDYVHLLTEQPAWYDYFTAAAAIFDGAPKTLANWMTRDLLKIARERSQLEIPLPAEDFAALVTAVEGREIVTAQVGEVLAALWQAGGGDPLAVAGELGLVVAALDEGELERVVGELVELHPEQARAVREGNAKLRNFFVGQAMKRFAGKADARRVMEVVRRVLGG